MSSSDFIVGEPIMDIELCFCNFVDDARQDYPDVAYSEFGFATGMSFRVFSEGLACLIRDGDTLIFKAKINHSFKDAYDFDDGGEYVFTHNDSSNLL